MKKQPPSPRDAAGQLIRAGDRVRLTQIPPLRAPAGPPRAELEAVLGRLRRTYKRIERIGPDGRLEIVFYVRIGPHRGLHTVRLGAKYFTKHR
ncbi:MAG TPA: hypothetical protein VF315_03935 [Steroidobacteraceae bacterium]